ncbi:MAG: PD40 domain-containing protein [Gemmatimonadales bacterium]|nr:PD40 domain-containing protein [Gemmatimonadales bacterium]
MHWLATPQARHLPGDGQGAIGAYLPWYAEWAPASPNRIAFRLLALNDGGTLKYHVAVIGINGAGFQDLTPVGVDAATQVRWSPDGGRVAFIDYTTGRLMVVNADGSGLIEIARNIGVDAPAWSPDGQRVAYFASKDEPRTLANERGIWSVKPDGTDRTKLRSASLNDFYEDLQLSPDGGRLVMCHRARGDECERHRTSSEPPARMLPAPVVPRWGADPDQAPP